jgi:signal-transduction protein with cAMP-binding, CBS, and nucleotidyltransferase domain
LLSRISIFSTLTAEEKATIAATMQGKEYKSGEMIAKAGTVLKALCIVSYGALVGSVEEKGRRRDLASISNSMPVHNQVIAPRFTLPRY